MYMLYNKFFSIILFILCLSCFPFFNCSTADTSTDDASISRALTSDEMAVPRGRYQDAINMKQNRQVPFNCPSIKPGIKWRKIQPNNSKIDFGATIFGNEKYVCYCTSDGRRMNSLLCLNIDGSKAWENDFPNIYDVWAAIPVISCEGAIILFEEYKHKGNPLLFYPLMERLECFDVKGNPVWSTESLQEQGLEKRAWRISNNRILMPKDVSCIDYKIYSLSDGRLLNSITFPEADIAGNWIGASGPLETKDGGWISMRKPINTSDYYVSRYRSDLSIVWDFKTQNLVLSGIFTEDGNIIVGSQDFLNLVDFETGKSIWEINQTHYHFQPCGITPQGNLIILTWTGIKNIHEYDKDGKVIWSFGLPHIPFSNNNDFVIYKDSEILFGCDEGLYLLDKNGELLWFLTKKELGLSDDDTPALWYLNPMSDGGVVINFWVIRKDIDQVIYLK